MEKNTRTTVVFSAHSSSSGAEKLLTLTLDDLSLAHRDPRDYFHTSRRKKRLNLCRVAFLVAGSKFGL